MVAYGNDKIFVSIPAYRDEELATTIKSALKSAEKPENLRFGIVNQHGPETEHILDEFRGDNRFRIVEVFWKDSLGVGWARRLIEDLYRDEEYVLQVDAHMIFEENWDLELKRQWHFCRDEKAVLSTYPTRFDYGENGEVIANRDKGLKITLYPTDAKMMFDAKAEIVPPNERVMERGMFVAGGLEFFRGEMLKEVKYIKEIMFVGEEIARGAQIYSHGYNVYIPIGVPIFHRYNREGAHKFWEDVEGERELKKVYDSKIEEGEKMINDILRGETGQYPEYFGEERKIDRFLEAFSQKSVTVTELGA